MGTRINTHFHGWLKDPNRPDKRAKRLPQQFDSVPKANEWIREQGYDRNEQASIHVCADDHPDPKTGQRNTPTKRQVLLALNKAMRQLEQKYPGTRIVLDNIDVRFEKKTGKPRSR